MNRITKTIKDGVAAYVVTTESGENFPCTRVYEKAKDKWHIKLPKDAAEITGRTYIVETELANKDSYEFATKTEHRTGLASGGWRAKMTPAEKIEVENAEALIERIKAEASKRETPKIDKDSIEYIEAEIAKLLAKKAKKAAEAKSIETPAPVKAVAKKKVTK